MGNIYKSAERVIVWLDNRAPTSWEALLALSILEASLIRRNAGPEAVNSGWDRFGTIRMRKALERLATGFEFGSFKKLLKRKQFTFATEADTGEGGKAIEVEMAGDR
jgi:hypothetical protein